MNERTPYFTWMFGFLAGGAAGASAALLLAPQWGQDVRRIARRKLRHGMGYARTSALAGDGERAVCGEGAQPVSVQSAARMAEWEAESRGEA